MNVYVASSWRNTHQPNVVLALRLDGHVVYDFMDSEGFGWSEVDPDWIGWDPWEYTQGLIHPAAERGFSRDMAALTACDACVYVMPCGVSASLEAGWAKGAGRLTICYIPALREPDLMVKMMDLITTDLDEVRAFLKIAAAPQVGSGYDQQTDDPRRTAILPNRR